MPRDLETIYDDMDLEMKVKVMELFIDDLRESGRKTNIDMEKLDQAMQRLKEYFDTRYGRFAVLIWKTPCSI
ncbi:unnamed protein product [Schistosoma intercalatum]|nr:unnamed protein product [Schistosoma intercalatum]